MVRKVAGGTGAMGVAALGLLWACTSEPAEEAATPAPASVSANADAATVSANRTAQLTSILDDLQAPGVFSSAWNDGVIQVGVHAAESTATDRIELCENLVAAADVTANEVTQVIVVAHPGDGVTASPDPAATALPVVRWLAESPECRADR